MFPEQATYSLPFPEKKHSVLPQEPEGVVPGTNGKPKTYIPTAR